MPQQSSRRKTENVFSSNPTYLFAQVYPFLPRLLCRLLLGMFLSLDFALVETSQILGAGTVVKVDFLDSVGGLAFFGRRWWEGRFLWARFGEHFGSLLCPRFNSEIVGIT